MNEQGPQSNVWFGSLHLAVQGFVHFIPAMVITWLMVEVVAPQVPGVPWLAQAGMFLLCLDFYLAAAAKAGHLSPENTFWLALSRAGICIEPMLVIFLLFVFSSACFLVVLYQDQVWLSVLAVSVAVVVDLYVLARVWPFWGIPFFFEGKTRWSPAARGRVWEGPGLGLAWRLTREQGVLNRHGLRFMAGFITLIVVVFGLQDYLAWDGLSDVVLYVLGLPVLSVITMHGTAELIRATNIDLGQYE